MWGSQRKCEWLQTEVSSRAGSSFESEADKCSTLLFVMRSRRLRAQKAVEGNGNRYSVKSRLWVASAAAQMQLHSAPGPTAGFSSLWREAAESDLEREAGEISELEMCHQMTQSPQSTLFGQICFEFFNQFSSRTSFSQYADFKIFRGQ